MLGADDSFSDLGTQSFSTTRGFDDWEEHTEDWATMPNGGLTTEDEKTAGPDGLVADGVIGEEYRRLRQAKLEARASMATPPRDPYHGRSTEPRLTREPPRESFNLMVVGEAGLGKTTLLESFFKSFKDDDATFALFERKETHSVIETRRQIEEASARRTVCERDMRVFAEKGQYTEANKAQQEVKQLGLQVERLTERLKELCASDEKRREELHALREKARTLRMDMKRASDQQDFPLAAEKQQLAEVVQKECDKLQAELKKMRARSTSKDGGGKGDEVEEQGEEEEGDGGPHRPRDAINAATVRVTPFDPFSISVGKHELQVTLVDTPGYGEFVNTEESFDVIGRYVEAQFEAHHQRESEIAKREPDRLVYDDRMIHCCLYFIAPHRLKHIDLAFMRRLHKYVNIVPIIAKSDTMTTKEKEEFKLQVREALVSSGVDLFPFDMDVVRQMEKQDKQEYKPPWAVIGSTDAYLEAGHTVYQRKYPWGNALSSEPDHSDLPALRNLVMWSGQWQELKLSTRSKYELWRAERGLLADASTSIGRVGHAAASKLAGFGRSAASRYRGACRTLRLPPRATLAVLLLLLLSAGGAAVASAVRERMAAEQSATHKLGLLREQVKLLSADKATMGQAYEAKHAKLSEQLGEANALAEEASTARRQLQREVAQLKLDLAREAKEAKGKQSEHDKKLEDARKAQARAETVAEAAKIRAASVEATKSAKCSARPPQTDVGSCQDGSDECAGGAEGANGQWKFGEWAYGAPERAWESVEGFAREAFTPTEILPKAREASRRAFGTLGSASDNVRSSAARASQAARGGVDALRKGAGVAAKQWLHEVKSAVQTPVG